MRCALRSAIERVNVCAPSGNRKPPEVARIFETSYLSPHPNRLARRSVLINGRRHECDVSKEELLEFEGVVTEVLPEGRFRVKLESGHEVLAYTGGRMKRNKIRTLAGDRVTVEMTPYDLDKARLVFRHRTDSGGPPGGGHRRPPPRK
jgi:translation initiation factor IF-1